MAETAVQSSGFPKGMDTLHPTMSMPDGTARRLQNVDVLDDGRVRRRAGTTSVFNAPTHSLFGYNRVGYAVVTNNLVLLQEDGSYSTIRANVGPNPVWYLGLNGQVYWSNGTNTGVSDVSGGDHIWGIPHAQPPVCTASAVGGLYAGGYQVCITFLLATGEEGGWADSTLVNVAAGGGITVTGLPNAVPHADITHFRVYVTAANSTTQFRYGDYPIGTASVSIVSTASQGEVDNSYKLYPFPACTNLTHYRGRVYGVTGNVLWYSEPLRYRLCDITKNFIVFDSDITMVADVNDGLYISDSKNTWVLSGNDPSSFERNLVFPYPALQGSPVRDARNATVYWFSTRGWCFGGPEKQAKNLTEDRLLPGTMTKAATLYREYNGVGQVLALVDEAGSSSATAQT